MNTLSVTFHTIIYLLHGQNDAMRKEAAKIPGQVLSNALCSVSNVTLTVLNRDQKCRLSNYADYVESAHLCPAAEMDWFKRCGMARYNIDPALPAARITHDS